MESDHNTEIIKNFNEKSIVVSRIFKAPLKNVWRAYSESELLDLWWGPQPWKAETKFLDFRSGGHWLYAMVGPDGSKHWARMNYITIEAYKSIQLEDCFCDENGIVNTDLPVSVGNMLFTETGEGTKVDFKMIYATTEELQVIVEMGFEEGITACLNQLAVLFKENKV